MNAKFANSRCSHHLPFVNCKHPPELPQAQGTALQVSAAQRSQHTVHQLRNLHPVRSSSFSVPFKAVTFGDVSCCKHRNGRKCTVQAHVSQPDLHL